MGKSQNLALFYYKLLLKFAKYNFVNNNSYFKDGKQ